MAWNESIVKTLPLKTAIELLLEYCMRFYERSGSSPERDKPGCADTFENLLDMVFQYTHRTGRIYPGENTLPTNLPLIELFSVTCSEGNRQITADTSKG